MILFLASMVITIFIIWIVIPLMVAMVVKLISKRLGVVRQMGFIKK